MSTITKCEHGGCDSKHDIAYILRQKEMEFVSMEGGIQNTTSLHSKEKRNGVRKLGGWDSKHDITYTLRKKEMEFVSVEDVIQNTISLTP